MADIMIQQTTSPPRKRNHEGLIVEHLDISEHTRVAETELSISAADRQISPAPSTAVSELTELTSSVTSPASKLKTIANVNGLIDGAAPAKKPKLTFAEREVEKAVKKYEKEQKEKAKADQKARREEEKRQKDEEKRQKEEEKGVIKRARDLEKVEKKKIDDARRVEREEKKRAKDAEKQEKEAEKAKKEAEKLKKERAQLRIASFFAKPAQSSTPPSIPDDGSIGVSSRRSSMTSIDMEELMMPVKAKTTTNAEFEKYIIPYFVHDHTELAPANRFRATPSAAFLDGQLHDNSFDIEITDLQPLAKRFRPYERKFRYSSTVKQLIEAMQPSTTKPDKHNNSPDSLRFVPLKFLSFLEDVRPPYTGTYTAKISSGAARKMARNPMYKGRPDTNYDYDSEAEWEPPAEDDDDINLEDEMSESEDEDEEMEDFLDDENDTQRRRLFVSEMEPISSGLCWDGELSADVARDLKRYRMEVLHDSTKFPIDPYSSIHWIDETRPKIVSLKPEVKIKNETDGKTEIVEASMPPPRLPLAPVNAPNSILSFATTAHGHIKVHNDDSASPVAKARGRPPTSTNKELKMIQAEYLSAFKQAVDGSDLTKAGLIEILKKQFPKCSKDAIKDTLGVVAVRVGKKEVEKKWTLV